MYRIYVLLITIMAVKLAAAQAATGQAERAEQIFWELQSSTEKGQTHTLLEEDLNAYLERVLANHPLRGIEQLSVKMNQNTFTTFLRVNLDEVELTGEVAYLEYLAKILGSPQRLKLEGFLEVSEGVGTYKTEEAWLNDMPLPASLVDLLLSSLGQQQEPPFDPTEPFEAPYGIRDLKVEPGKALLKK